MKFQVEAHIEIEENEGTFIYFAREVEAENSLEAANTMLRLIEETYPKFHKIAEMGVSRNGRKSLSWWGSDE